MRKQGLTGMQLHADEITLVRCSFDMRLRALHWLRPERLTQFDLGVRADYDVFQAGVNGFYAWVDNYITYDVNRSGLGLTQVVYTNTDRATLAGAEFFTQADLTAWLTPFGTASAANSVTV